MPGGSARPSGHRQGTPSPGCITCRGPEWRGRLCGVALAPLAVKFRDQEKSSEGLRLTQPAAQQSGCPTEEEETPSHRARCKTGPGLLAPQGCSLGFQQTQS